MHRTASQREQEQLIEATRDPADLQGFQRNGYAKQSMNCCPDRPAPAGRGSLSSPSTRLAIRFCRGVLRRTRRIADLASVTIIEHAAKQVSDWVSSFRHPLRATRDQ